MGRTDAELSIVVTDDPGIKALNRQYRNRPEPTNVLAFSMREGEFGDMHPDILGDVVISMESAAREAHDLGISAEARFKFLLIHGILHLMGYGHEAGADQRRRMEEKSETLFDMIKPLTLNVEAR